MKATSSNSLHIQSTANTTQIVVVCIITSAKEIMFSSVLVCLSASLFVSRITLKVMNRFSLNLAGRLSVIHGRTQ